jgi:hypothetical protein
MSGDVGSSNRQAELSDKKDRQRRRERRPTQQSDKKADTAVEQEGRHSNQTRSPTQLSDKKAVKTVGQERSTQLSDSVVSVQRGRKGASKEKFPPPVTSFFPTPNGFI